jgi:DNA-binding MarR family transcriptional regulator
MDEHDALSTLRLIANLASRFAEAEHARPIGQTVPGESSVFTFTETGASPASSVPGESATPRATRQALPDPRLVRRIIRHRQLRAQFFDGDLFADPAWDMLLDLTAARAEHIRVSVTSLCIASGVPPTTALRWISELTQAGLLARTDDETDRRRAFITLSDKAASAMARYFAELGQVAAQLL